MCVCVCVCVCVCGRAWAGVIGGSGVQVDVVECAGVCVRSALKTLIRVAALFRHDNTRTVILKEKGKGKKLRYKSRERLIIQSGQAISGSALNHFKRL